jgi:hypothetical protein
MSVWTSKHRLKRASGRVLFTLLAGMWMVSLSGCAYFQNETIETGPVGYDYDPVFTNGPSWGGATNVFGTPPWGGPSAFATPALGVPPGVYGIRMQVPPGESPAAKVLTLTEQLAASKTETENLNSRIHGLEAEVEAGNKALARATSEVVETRTELANARADLENWKREISALREKLENADKENLSTLQSTVGLLQKLMISEQPPAEGE